MFDGIHKEKEITLSNKYLDFGHLITFVKKSFFD